MAHTVTSKLNQNAKMHQLQSGDAMFFVSLSEKVYNHTTKQNEYTNYDAALYAKQSQIQFYQSALVVGSVVSVTGKTAKIEVYQKNDGTQGAKIALNECSLDFIHSEQGAQQQAPQQNGWGQAAAPQPPQQQAPQQQAPQQQWGTPPQAPQQQGEPWA